MGEIRRAAASARSEIEVEAEDHFSSPLLSPSETVSTPERRFDERSYSMTPFRLIKSLFSRVIYVGTIGIRQDLKECMMANFKLIGESRPISCQKVSRIIARAT
jgi:hypothetical protein